MEISTPSVSYVSAISLNLCRTDNIHFFVVLFLVPFYLMYIFLVIFSTDLTKSNDRVTDLPVLYISPRAIIVYFKSEPNLPYC